MTPSLTLRAATAHCTLLPGCGGSISGLWLGDWCVLQTPHTGTPAQGLDTASYPLVPYSNRIGSGRFTWNGQEHQLAPLFAPEPHSIHGVGWAHAWQVLQHSACDATLEYVHPGDAGWPCPFAATQTFVLEAHALTLTMVVRNTGAAEMPVGLGWHPYFPKNSTTQLSFQAAARWEMGPDQLPTRRLPHTGLQTDCATLAVDHCFEGWSGPVTLRYPGHRIAIQSDLANLVVFTHPGRDTIAVEPVSHVNNALQLAPALGQRPETLGVRFLAPGAETRATMRIDFEEQT